MDLVKQVLSNDDITKVEDILFNKLLLDKSILDVKQEQKCAAELRINIAKDYVKKKLEERAIEAEDTLMYTKKCYVRMFLYHPDTRKSYLQLISKFKRPKDKDKESKPKKKSYISICNSGMHLNEMDTIDIPLICQEDSFVKFKLEKKLLGKVLMYLILHGAVLTTFWQVDVLTKKLIK